MPLKKIISSVILSAFLITGSVCSAYADENKEDELTEKSEPQKNYRGVGVTVGYLSALGLSYRQFFGDKFGFKGTGIVFFDQSQTFGALGLQGMWVLGENDWARFYGLAGVSNFTIKRKAYEYATPSPATYGNTDYVSIPPKGYSNYEMYNSVGAGIGIELGRQEQGLSFAIELPWILSFKNTTVNSFYPIPSLSVMYNF